MRNIEAYETTDGRIFTDKNKAQSHQFDLVGEALDTLIVDCPDGRITRENNYITLLSILTQPNLGELIGNLYEYVQGSDVSELNKAAQKQIDLYKGK